MPWVFILEKWKHTFKKILHENLHSGFVQNSKKPEIIKYPPRIIKGDIHTIEYYSVFKRWTTNICMDMHEYQKYYKEKMIEWIKLDINCIYCIITFLWNPRRGKSNLQLKISSDWLGIGKGCFTGKESEGTSGVM